MIKTLNQILKSEKEPFKVPSSVQDTIPIKKIWKDGTFQVGNKFSRTFRFTDVNYSVAARDDQLAMFLAYCELLIDDVLDLGVDLTLGHAEDRAVHIDILASRQLPVKAGPDLKHGSNAAVQTDHAGSRRGDP